MADQQEHRSRHRDEQNRWGSRHAVCMTLTGTKVFNGGGEGRNITFVTGGLFCFLAAGAAAGMRTHVDRSRPRQPQGRIIVTEDDMVQVLARA